MPPSTPSPSAATTSAGSACVNSGWATGEGGGGLLLAGVLGQVQLSLEELPCQNLLQPSLALWRQITARDAQDGIAVVGRAIHAVAIATEVDLLLRQLGVLENKLPRPLNRLVRGGGRSAGERQDARSVCGLLVSGGLGGGRRGLVPSRASVRRQSCPPMKKTGEKKKDFFF